MFDVPATTILAGEVGKVSKKLTPSMLVGVGLFSVTMSVDVPPEVIESGTNRFLIVTLEGPIISKVR